METEKYLPLFKATDVLREAKQATQNQDIRVAIGALPDKEILLQLQQLAGELIFTWGNYEKSLRRERLRQVGR